MLLLELLEVGEVGRVSGGKAAIGLARWEGDLGFGAPQPSLRTLFRMDGFVLSATNA